MRLGAKLREVREAQRKSLKEIAERANMSVAQLSKLELGERGLAVEVFFEIARALGHQPGDLLPNSAGLYPEFRPLLTRLGAVPEASRPVVLRAIAAILDMREEVIASAPTNVVQFPSPERTEPRWTEEFPIEPNEYVEGDFDYPLELHALEVEEFEVAAGDTGVNPEVDMAAYTLHAKDVRDSTHRVIKVKGDSMSPDYEEGWKLLVDTRKRSPRPGDPVAVYLNNQGSVLGYWSPTGDHVELEKANTAYRPVSLGDPSTWHLIGTVQKVVDAPAKKRRKLR